MRMLAGYVDADTNYPDSDILMLLDLNTDYDVVKTFCPCAVMYYESHR